MKTTDEGENWFIQFNAPGAGILSSIYFVDSLYGWASIYNRRPFKTTNGGENWIKQTNFNYYQTDDVYFKDTLNGWLLSGNKLYRTNDGGDTWFQDTQISAYTSQFKIINDSHFIITWNIYESTDAGDTWLNITPEVGTSFLNLHAPYEYFCIPIGTRGLVMNYIDTTLVSTGHNLENIPLSFDLKQNYPNPFNPSTKIKFSIPAVETHRDAFLQVKLIVYDVLGREVATLVNEEKPTGEYEVEFSGSGLPSGIYFYQLKTESFVETKKMILMK